MWCLVCKGDHRHLASYEQVLVDVLTAFLDAGPTPYLTRFTEQSEQFNETEGALCKEQTMSEVLGKLNDAHSHVMPLVAQIPREMLREVGTLPGMAESTPWMIFSSSPTMSTNSPQPTHR